MERRSVLRETHSILGAVPQFIEQMPDPHIEWMWRSMRDVELLPGQIPAKHQQLVMLAVAASSKCRYGIDFHTELAKALGATLGEIGEIAILTAHTSARSAYLTTAQVDFEQFKRDVRAAAAALSGEERHARR